MKNAAALLTKNASARPDRPQPIPPPNPRFRATSPTRNSTGTRAASIRSGRRPASKSRTSVSKSGSGRIAMPFFRTRGEISLGNSLALGIFVPPNSNGTIFFLASSADLISKRTMSLGSSSRRLPSSSVRSNQSGPIAINTYAAVSSAAVISSMKSSPRSMFSTSRNTTSFPKRSVRRR